MYSCYIKIHVWLILSWNSYLKCLIALEVRILMYSYTCNIKTLLLTVYAWSGHKIEQRSKSHLKLHFKWDFDLGIDWIFIYRITYFQCLVQLCHLLILILINFGSLQELISLEKINNLLSIKQFYHAKN